MLGYCQMPLRGRPRFCRPLRGWTFQSRTASAHSLSPGRRATAGERPGRSWARAIPSQPSSRTNCVTTVFGLPSRLYRELSGKSENS